MEKDPGSAGAGRSRRHLVLLVLNAALGSSYVDLTFKMNNWGENEVYAINQLPKSENSIRNPNYFCERLFQ